MMDCSHSIASASKNFPAQPSVGFAETHNGQRLTQQWIRVLDRLTIRHRHSISTGGRTESLEAYFGPTPHLWSVGAFILVGSSMYEDLQGGQVPPQPLFNSQLVSVEVAVNESKPWRDCEAQCRPPPIWWQAGWMVPLMAGGIMAVISF